jgi:8-oxo-dGTP pyrophosphatase MutT (NUDIX family)
MTEIPLRDAATVMLVRDAPSSSTVPEGESRLEVFMLRRNLNSDFVGGAYVFPGGGVDDHDRHENLEPVCHGRSDAGASAQLGIDTGGLSFWVAAIRESFEEAGVLLAYGPDGELVRLDEPVITERFVTHRRAVDKGERRLVEVCADEGLRLAVDSIYYFSHWITPEGAPRRYDTRFFVARAPEAQVPVHDDHEVIANLWIRPVDALARHRAGEFEMIFPTIRTLIALERFASADDLLAAAAAIGEVPVILPRIVNDGGGLRIVLPGDPGYDDLMSADLSGGVSLSSLAANASRPDVGRSSSSDLALSAPTPGGGTRAPSQAS